MSQKLILNRLLKINFVFIFMFSFLVTHQYANAQYGFSGGVQAQAGFGGGFGGGYGGGMGGGAGYGGQGQWGSGQWGGQQQCAYNQRAGSGATDMSDDEKELRSKISSLQTDLKKRKSEKTKFESEMKFARTRLEKVFDGDVLDFLLDTHIQNDYQCDKYKDFNGYDCDPKKGTTVSTAVDADGKTVEAPKTDCGSKIDVTAKLKANWNKGKNYCAANSTSDGGKISAEICSDDTLRPDDRKRSLYSPSECNKFLADYRKNKILADNAQAKITRAEDDIEVRKSSISDARERAKLDREDRLRNQTEATDCPECDQQSRGYSYQAPKRDWTSIIGQIGLGLGMGYLGKQYDDRNAEYQAQLGYPPQQGYPTAVSMGAPFVLGGIYGAINGTQGQGAFGCAGQGGMGLGNGAYGPYGPGGAFGYPQGMFGSPWGGGMYPPGMYPGGGMAGPNGGWPGGMNGGFALNGMLNGGIAMGGGYMGGNMQGGYMQGGGYMGGNMQGGYPMSGYMMGGAIGGGIAMGGYMGGNMQGGYPMSGNMQGGGYMGGNMQGGYPMSGYMMGGAIGGGIAMGGYMGGNMQGGYMQGGGGYMGGNMQGGYMQGGSMQGIGQYMNNPQYLQMQQQQMQMQQQMQQQQQQMQQQYYQAQMQAQMQAYQRQAAVQQQAQQVQTEIAQLQMRLQMLYSGGSFSGGSSGGGYYGVGAGGGYSGGYGSAAPTPNGGNNGGYSGGGYLNTNSQPNYPNNNGAAQPYYPGNNNPGNGGSAVTIPAPGR